MNEFLLRRASGKKKNIQYETIKSRCDVKDENMVAI